MVPGGSEGTGVKACSTWSVKIGEAGWGGGATLGGKVRTRES